MPPTWNVIRCLSPSSDHVQVFFRNGRETQPVLDAPLTGTEESSRLETYWVLRGCPNAPELRLPVTPVDLETVSEAFTDPKADTLFVTYEVVEKAAGREDISCRREGHGTVCSVVLASLPHQALLDLALSLSLAWDQRLGFLHLFTLLRGNEIWQDVVRLPAPLDSSRGGR